MIVVRLTVCGVDYGDVQVGDDSLIAMLAQGETRMIVERVTAIHDEIDALSDHDKAVSE